MARGVSIVTGGGSGIGRAVALRLAQRGHDLALLGRRATPLDAVAEEIGALGRRALVVPCDVRDGSAVDEARTHVERAFEAPAVLVHAAGIILRDLAHETSPERWNDVIATNLTGVFLVTRALLPRMLSARRGRVVAVASISSVLGTARASAYCASKWGLVGYMKSLAEELRGTGLQAMSVLPGSVDTAMLAGSGYDAQMSAAEVANLIVYAALDAPAAMNGTAIEMFGP